MKKNGTPANNELLATRMEELDHVLRVVRPRTWVALATVGALAVLAIVWGFTGRVTTKTTGQGILMKGGILFPVVAAYPGQIKEINVEPGMIVHPKDVLARLDQPLLRAELREAQTLLTRLREDKAILERHEEEHDVLLKQHLAKKRIKLEESIRIGLALIKGQQNLVDAIAALSERGASSLLDLEKQKAELRQAQIQLLEDEQALIGISVEEHQLTYEVDRRLSDLIRMILPVNERVISLQEQLDSHSVVASPYRGYVVELHKNRGDIVRDGDSVVLLELTSEEGRPKAPGTLVVAYVASFQGMDLEPGMAAHVIPDTVREEEFGVMLGEVISVSPYPVSRKGMMRMLGNEEWVQALAREGAPTMVTIRLHNDPTTATGYRWSSGKGPPGGVRTGSQCLVRIVARQQAPVDLVIPHIKRNLFGVGEDTH